MYEYIEKMIKELPANMEGLATIPASSYLFNTDPGCKKLCEEQGQLFHHLVANLLCLSNHTIQDIQTAVAFLYTRVREPDTDDYKNFNLMQGEVKLAFCPMMNMFGDFITNPLKGSRFKRIRSIILNMPNTDKSSTEHTSVLESEKNNNGRVSRNQNMALTNT